MRFYGGIIHERVDPVEFFVTDAVPYAWFADVVRVQFQLWGRESQYSGGYAREGQDVLETKLSRTYEQ
jgi:hypothetical protein